MFYLVGPKAREGQDWIYEISKGRVKKAFCAQGNYWHRNIVHHFRTDLGEPGVEVGNQIIASVENLDFVGLTKKKREKVLEIISKYYNDLLSPNHHLLRGDWVFKIQLEHREISTLC